MPWPSPFSSPGVSPVEHVTRQVFLARLRPVRLVDVNPERQAKREEHRDKSGYETRLVQGERDHSLPMIHFLCFNMICSIQARGCVGRSPGSTNDSDSDYRLVHCIALQYGHGVMASVKFQTPPCSPSSHSWHSHQAPRGRYISREVNLRKFPRQQKNGRHQLSCHSKVHNPALDVIGWRLDRMARLDTLDRLDTASNQSEGERHAKKNDPSIKSVMSVMRKRKPRIGIRHN